MSSINSGSNKSNKRIRWERYKLFFRASTFLNNLSDMNSSFRSDRRHRLRDRSRPRRNNRLAMFLYSSRITYFFSTRWIFIYLFIYDKGSESATDGTDMPMTVNSKLTHYKIRQISTENKSVLKTKDLKTDKLLKWCSSAGRQFPVLTTLSAKKNFCAH